MTGLWSDGWFYISAVGFLISSVLFIFLLGQYKAAVEASDEPEESLPPMPLPSSLPINVPVIPLQKTEKKPEKTLILPPVPAPRPAPVSAPAPKPAAAPAVVAAPPPKPATAAATVPAPIPAPAPKPAAAPAVVAAPPPKPATAAAVVPAPVAAPPPKPAAVAAAAPASEATQGPDHRKSESTLSGQNSPAVAYLQNIKMQMEKFDKEIAGLKALSSQQAAQNEAIMRKLTELAEQMRGKPVVSAGKPAASPVAAAEAPAAVPPAPAPAAKPAMTIERSSSPPKAAPAPRQEPPKPEIARPVQPTTPMELKEPPGEAPKRKGPVWPV